MADANVIVVGAGIGGLMSALILSGRGLNVTVLERAAAPGGKMRQRADGGRPMDAGPTVFTLKRVFEEAFDSVGLDFDALAPSARANVLARHAWDGDGRLDLFADVGQSVDAIGRLAGASEAEGFKRFTTDSARIWRTLERSFVRAPRPEFMGLVRGRRPWRTVRSARHTPVRIHVGRARRLFPRSAPASIVRPLLDLLRLIPLPCARDADARRACGAGRRLDDRGRHAPAGSGLRRAGERVRRHHQVRRARRVAVARRRPHDCAPRGRRDAERRRHRLQRRCRRHRRRLSGKRSHGRGRPGAARRKVAVSPHMDVRGPHERFSPRAPQRLLLGQLPLRIRRARRRVAHRRSDGLRVRAGQGR